MAGYEFCIDGAEAPDTGYADDVGLARVNAGAPAYSYADSLAALPEAGAGEPPRHDEETRPRLQGALGSIAASLAEKANRNWTLEFEEVLVAGGTEAERAARLYRLTKEFRDIAGAIGRCIIQEQLLPPAERSFRPEGNGSLGVAGGEKYLVPGPGDSGIFFKFAIDAHGLYGGDAFAAKAAKHELTSVQALAAAAAMTSAAGAGAGAEGVGLSLGIPLLATVDYLGQRLLACSILPVGPTTLAYGSANAGADVLASSPQLVSALRQACDTLNIGPHNVACRPPAWAGRLRQLLLPRVVSAAGGAAGAGLARLAAVDASARSLFDGEAARVAGSDGSPANATESARTAASSAVASAGRSYESSVGSAGPGSAAESRGASGSNCGGGTGTTNDPGAGKHNDTDSSTAVGGSSNGSASGEDAAKLGGHQPDAVASRGPPGYRLPDTPTSRVLWGPIDLEAHETRRGPGRQSHSYVLDAARLFPAEAPASSPTGSRCSVVLLVPADARRRCVERHAVADGGAGPARGPAWARVARTLLASLATSSGREGDDAGGSPMVRVPLACGMLLVKRQPMGAGLASPAALAAAGVRPRAVLPSVADIVLLQAAHRRGEGPWEGGLVSRGASAEDLESASAHLHAEAESDLLASGFAPGEADEQRADESLVAEWQAKAEGRLVEGVSRPAGLCGSSVLPTLPLGWGICSRQERRLSGEAEAAFRDAAAAAAASAEHNGPAAGSDGGRFVAPPEEVARAASAAVRRPPVNARASRLAGRVIRGDAVLVVGMAWNLTALQRPEAVAMCSRPMSSDVFSGFGKCARCADTKASAAPDCGHDRQRHEARAEWLAAHISRTAVPRLAAALDSGQASVTDPVQLPPLLHASGINLRRLGKLRACLRSPWARSVVLVEVLARTLRVLLLARLRNALASLEAPDAALSVAGPDPAEHAEPSSGGGHGGGSDDEVTAPSAGAGPRRVAFAAPSTSFLPPVGADAAPPSASPAASAGPKWALRALRGLLNVAFGESPAADAFWAQAVPCAVDEKFDLAELLSSAERDALAAGRQMRRLEGVGKLPLLARLAVLAGFGISREDVRRLVASEAVLQCAEPFVAETDGARAGPESDEEGFVLDAAGDTCDDPSEHASPGGIASLTLSTRTRSVFDETDALAALEQATGEASGSDDACSDASGGEGAPRHEATVTGASAASAAASAAAAAAEAALAAGSSSEAGARQAWGADGGRLSLRAGVAGSGWLTELAALVASTIGERSVEHAQVATRLAQALRREGACGKAAQVAVSAAARAPPLAGLVRAMALAVAAEALEDALASGEPLPALSALPAGAGVSRGHHGLDRPEALYTAARAIAARFAPVHPLVARLSCSLARCALRKGTRQGKADAVAHMAASFTMYDAVYGSSSALELIVPAIIAGTAEDVGASMGQLCIAALEASGSAVGSAARDEAEDAEAEESLGEAGSWTATAAAASGKGPLGEETGPGAKEGTCRSLPANCDRSLTGSLSQEEDGGREVSSAKAFAEALRLSSEAASAGGGSGGAGGGARSGASLEGGAESGSKAQARRMLARMAGALAAVEDMLGYQRGHFIGKSAADAATDDTAMLQRGIGPQLLRRATSAGQTWDDGWSDAGDSLGRDHDAATVGTGADGELPSSRGSVLVSEQAGSEAPSAEPLSSAGSDGPGLRAAHSASAGSLFEPARWEIHGPADSVSVAVSGQPVRLLVLALGADGEPIPIPRSVEVGGVLEGPTRHLATVGLATDAAEGGRGECASLGGGAQRPKGAAWLGRVLWFVPVVAGAYACVITLGGAPVAVGAVPVRVVAEAADPWASLPVAPLEVEQGARFTSLALLKDISGNTLAIPQADLLIQTSTGSLSRAESMAWRRISGASFERCPDAGLAAVLAGRDSPHWTDFLSVTEAACGPLPLDAGSAEGGHPSVAGLPVARVVAPRAEAGREAEGSGWVRVRAGTAAPDTASGGAGAAAPDLAVVGVGPRGLAVLPGGCAGAVAVCRTLAASPGRILLSLRIGRFHCFGQVSTQSKPPRDGTGVRCGKPIFTMMNTTAALLCQACSRGGLVVCLICERPGAGPRRPATLCNVCTFSKANNCARCSARVPPHTGVAATICTACAFTKGSKCAALK
ncbi:hypothetical protein FNF27_00485 [Cafeteria roenbergensis]|uniref:Clu domain-containing protein n=3 Tax=Cafeteria roenbergensis TaxID=33653 RepID=A0A5A8EMN4_CAFRO|nr:hypothetical protein FNF27_00485 [Cafeteria roenbergensis]